MNEPTPEAPGGWSPLKIGGFALGGLILLLLLIPTFRSPAPKNTTTDGEAPAEDVTRSECERWLESALDGMQPARLGMSSEARVMADTLNNWLSECGADAAPITGDQDAQLRQSLLTKEGFERSEGERYQPRDADHIRNTLLARAIVERVTADLRTDRERALALFYFVVRTLDLTPDEGPDLMLTPYDALVYGIGSAADRAWTYALLMRQLRLDVVMIQPRTEGEKPYWLIGAIIPGEGVILLDPRLGLPIVPESELQDPQTPLPMKMMTLAQVRENDALLRQFDRPDRKYPLTAGDLASVDVFGIGTSSAFAPRMGRLAAELPEPLEIYDGLASKQLREHGLIDRLKAAGSDGLWTAEQVHIWPYPERHWTDLDEGTEEGQMPPTLAKLASALAGPYTISITVDVSDEGEVSFGTEVEKSQMTLRRARIEQLMGNFTAAQQGYLQSRLKNVDASAVQEYVAALAETVQQNVQDPQQQQQMLQQAQQSAFQQVDQLIQALPEMESNAIAAQFATYWSAQAQYDQQDFRVAAESSMAYLQRSGGSFVVPAVYLAAVSLAQDARPADAAGVLGQLPPQAPQWLGNQALVERWRRLADPNYQPETKSPEPQEQKTETPEPATEPSAPADDATSEPAEGPAPSTDRPPAPSEPFPVETDASTSEEVK